VSTSLEGARYSVSVLDSLWRFPAAAPRLGARVGAAPILGDRGDLRRSKSWADHDGVRDRHFARLETDWYRVDQ